MHNEVNTLFKMFIKKDILETVNELHIISDGWPVKTVIIQLFFVFLWYRQPTDISKEYNIFFQ